MTGVKIGGKMKLWKWIGWGALGVLALGLIGGGIGFFWLRTSLPQLNGEITLRGLSSEVTVHRDPYGIPHIYAENEADLYFAVGFVHAQDRLWQMEFNRRTAQGRLSEIVGASTVPIDRMMRTLGVYRKAESAYTNLDSETRDLLAAYAEGVNAFLATRSGALPPEFVLLGIDPEPWRPQDSMGWLKMVAWDLGANWSMELSRLSLLRQMPAERVQEFFPPYPGDAPLPLPDLAELYDGLDLNVEAAALPAPAETALGSNNWVVSGARTETGKPLLANDPHLRLNTPSIWYMAHLSVGGRNVVGYTMAGVPFVILGRTDRIAWGFTNTSPDVQDLFLEKITDPATGAYQTPDGTARLAVRSEEIGIRGEDPLTIEIRESRHGPIISDAIESLRKAMPEGTALAFQWTALEDTDSTVAGARNIFEARSFDELRQLMRGYKVPQQNMVYADTDGNIGYLAPAKVPVRSTNNAAKGLIPAPGWKAESDWIGQIPYDELPARYNPPSGMIATANEKIVDDDYPHFLTYDWSLPYRGDRIRELLKATPKHSVATFRDIQLDVMSTISRDLLPHFLRLADGIDAEVRMALAEWDLDMAAGRPEPLIITGWHRAVQRRLFADELGEEFGRFWNSKTAFLLAVLSDTDGQSRWCDDVTTETEEDCGWVVTEAFADSWNELVEEHGDDWRSWAWGDAHITHQYHRPFSGFPVLGNLFSLSAPRGGGLLTVDVAAHRFSSRRPFENTSGASMRAIYDFADLDDSRFILPTGQSGILFSDHYDDQMPLWLAGEYLTIPTDPAAVEAATEHTLQLTPAP